MQPPFYTEETSRPQQQQPAAQPANTAAPATSRQDQYLNGRYGHDRPAYLDTRVNLTANKPTVARVNGDVLDKASMVVVVDTNFLLSSLDLTRSLVSIALQHKLVVVIPWIVVQELDNLKTSHRSKINAGGSLGSISFLAREAIRYIDQELGRAGSALRGQRRSESLKREIVNDDQILDCCLYFMEQRGLPVTILSNDRNMNIKARINGCTTCGDWKGTAAGLISAIAKCSGEDTAELRRKGQISVEPIVIPDSPPTRTLDSQSAPEGASASQRKLAVPKSRVRTGMARATLPMVSYRPPPPPTTQYYTNYPPAATASADEDRQVDDVVSFKKQRRSDSSASSAWSGSAGFGFKAVQPTPQVASAAAAAGSFASMDSSQNPQHQQQCAPIIIPDSDSENGEGMDVDIELLVVNDSPKETPQPGPNVHVPAPRQFMPVAACNQQPEPIHNSSRTVTNADGSVVVYLDDIPETAVEIAKKNTIASQTTVGVSRRVITFAYDNSCALTQFMMKRLSRNLTGSYAETWQDVLERHFKRPPWKSCTVMLTIIIVYWDIFKAALPYDLLDKIKSILPWVMHVEGVNSCPQVSGPLPPGATVAAFHYTAATTASGDARVVEAMQTQERLSQTVNLINTMKQLLVQCETVESDEQTAHREKLVKEWVMWVRSNSNS